MNTEPINAEDPQIKKALEELRGMIAEHYPKASFEVAPGEDPEGIYLTATVDVEDTTEVMDVVVDRLIDLQVEHNLPVYVVPVQPLERVIDELRRPKRKLRPRIELEDIPPGLQA